MNSKETRASSQDVFSGRVVRAVCYRRGKVSFERFFLIMGEAMKLPDSRHLGLFGPKAAKTADLVGTYDFFDQPKTAPALVYERRIASSVSSEVFLNSYFRGSGSAYRTDEAPASVHVDLDGIAPIPFGQFWDLVHGAEKEEAASARPETSDIGDRLARLSVPELFAFQRRLAEVLSAVDHPANAVRSESEPGVFVVSADASLYFRCRTVLAGKSAYENLLGSPGIGLPAHDVPGGDQLLSAATVALRALGEHIEFTGGPDFETGANAALWGEVAAPPKRPGGAAPVDALASRQATLDFMASFEKPSDGDPWFDAKLSFAFFTVRLALKTSEGFAERVYLYPTRYGELPNDPLQALVTGLSDVVLEVDGPQSAAALAIPNYGLLLHSIFRSGMTAVIFRQRVVDVESML